MNRDRLLTRSSRPLFGGLLLPFDRFVAPAATALDLTLGPATIGGHRFWERSDPREREQQQMHFLKNVAIFGGLALAARAKS
jgi:uncharacterized membrane protein YphA (DoxX/SURF4 family)